jgi:hypothetical protein
VAAAPAIVVVTSKDDSPSPPVECRTATHPARADRD